MKNTKPTTILLLILLICSFGLSKDLKSQATLNKIVIDAGHGGKDPGASGKYSREKDVALSIALKTGQLIKEMHPDIEIVYTRTTDVFIPLKERAEIANRSNADLFVSIHCNSNKSSQPNGSETYVMGLHKSEANLDVAKAENSAILFEEDYKTNYDGFDPTSEENHIIFNFFQNSFLHHNLDLATKVQSQFNEYTPLQNRGVKQAGFWVLYKTTMPGVLIETGFLSNTKDEKFLNSKEGQKKLSEAIAVAISDYKKDHDAKEKLKVNQKNNSQIVSHTDPEEGNAIIKEEKIEEISSSIKETTSPAKTEEEVKIQAEGKTSPVVVEQKESSPKEQVIYKVQFLSLSTNKKLTGDKYDQIQPISSYKHNGMYRYTSGSTNDYNEALQLQTKVRKAGFKDAFVVAFYNEQRISIKEAKMRK